SGGLVLSLPPLGPGSRRRFLLAQAAERGLNLGDEALAWLVQQTPGSFRQLAGVIGKVNALPHGNEAMLLGEVQRRLSEVPPGEGLTVERIAREVGRYYRVPPARLRGKSRQRAALVP